MVRDDPGGELRHDAASEHLERGDYETVLAITARLIDESPGDDAAHALRARALLVLGRLSEAERHAADAVRLDPDEIAYRELLAEVRSQGGAHGDAAYEYGRLARIDPRQTEWVAAEARERADASEPETAVLAARRALRLDPRNAPAQLALAQALVALRDRRESLQAARLALELLPGDVRARELVADAQRLAGNDAAAFADYRVLAGELPDADASRIVDKARRLYRQRSGVIGRALAGWRWLFAIAFRAGWLSLR